MRKLNEVKIQAPSCYEIHDFITAEAKRLKRQGMKWKYKLSHGPLLNFLLAWYEQQTPEMRRQIAEQGKLSIEQILDKDYVDPGAEPGPTKPKISKADGRGLPGKNLPNNRNSDKPVGKHLSGVHVG